MFMAENMVKEVKEEFLKFCKASGGVIREESGGLTCEYESPIQVSIGEEDGSVTIFAESGKMTFRGEDNIDISIVAKRHERSAAAPFPLITRFAKKGREVKFSAHPITEFLHIQDRKDYLKIFIYG